MVNQEKKVRRPLPGTDAEAGASHVIGRHSLSGMRLLSEDGASGLVYAAVEEDWRGTGVAAHLVVKECYPLSCADRLKRRGSRLESAEGELPPEFEAARRSYRDAFVGQARAYQGPAREAISVPVAAIEANNTVYLISDASEGATLDAAVATMSPVEQLSAVGGVCDAVAALHDAGYAYLDLKPANILVLESGGGVRLFDFDSVASLSDLAAGDAAVLGSEGWSSWEQMHLGAAGSVGRGSDVYAAGALVFWLAFGRAPSDTEVIRADGRWRLTAKSGGHPVLTGSAQALSALNRILSGTLTCDADGRFSSMRDVRRAISDLAEAIAPATVTVADALEAQTGEIVGEIRELEGRLSEKLERLKAPGRPPRPSAVRASAVRTCAVELLPEDIANDPNLSPHDWEGPADPGLPPASLTLEQRNTLALVSLAGDTGILADAAAACCGAPDAAALEDLRAMGLIDASPSTGLVRLPGWMDPGAALRGRSDDGPICALLAQIERSLGSKRPPRGIKLLSKEACAALGQAAFDLATPRLVSVSAAAEEPAERAVEALAAVEESYRARGDFEGVLAAKMAAAHVLRDKGDEAALEAACGDVVQALLSSGSPHASLEAYRKASAGTFVSSQRICDAVESLYESIPPQERSDADRLGAFLGLKNHPDFLDDEGRGGSELRKAAALIAEDVADPAARLECLLCFVHFLDDSDFSRELSDSLARAERDCVRRCPEGGLPRSVALDAAMWLPDEELAEQLVLKGLEDPSPLASDEIFDLGIIVSNLAFLCSADSPCPEDFDAEALAALADKVAERAVLDRPYCKETFDLLFSAGFSPAGDRWLDKRAELLAGMLSDASDAFSDEALDPSERAVACTRYMSLCSCLSDGWGAKDGWPSAEDAATSALDLLREHCEETVQGRWLSVFDALFLLPHTLPRLSAGSAEEAEGWARWALGLASSEVAKPALSVLLALVAKRCEEQLVPDEVLVEVCDKSIELMSQVFPVESVYRVATRCHERMGLFDEAADNMAADFLHKMDLRSLTYSDDWAAWIAHSPSFSDALARSAIDLIDYVSDRIEEVSGGKAKELLSLALPVLLEASGSSAGEHDPEDAEGLGAAESPRLAGTPLGEAEILSATARCCHALATACERMAAQAGR